MKGLFSFWFLLILLGRIYPFGPPGMANVGVYRSNAAGLPLEQLGEVEEIEEIDQIVLGSEENAWVLVVSRNDEGMEERLYHRQNLVSSRNHLYQDGERVIREYSKEELVEAFNYSGDGITSLTLRDGETKEFSLSSGENLAVPMPRGDQEEVYRYSNQGSLIAISDEDRHMLFADNLWGIRKNQGREGNFFLSSGDEAMFSFWRGDQLIRTETSSILPNNRWREETVKDEKGEIVKVYDAENRLRSVRTRGKRGYSFSQYDYPSPTMVIISYRAKGIDEEARIYKDPDGELERLIVQREGRMIAEIEQLEASYLHTLYDDAEEAYQEEVDEKELKNLVNSYPSLSVDGALW